MNASKTEPLEIHDDTALFREALRFTAAETGFIPRLIEKDYFCTLVLKHLCASDTTLAFKGGTCLAKVHAGFYRLSEDLDFSISMPTESARSARSRAADAFKAVVKTIPAKLRPFTIVEAVSGANGSKQYVATVAYDSLLGANRETIKIEVGLREPLRTTTVVADAHTLLLDPIRGRQIVQSVPLPCISLIEAMAEKFRAALTRRDVAIRDFYDIDHAVRNSGLNPLQPDLLELIARKLDVPDNGAIDVSDTRLQALRQQLEAQLKPVLRSQDFSRFALDRAFDVVRAVAGELCK
jgi:predicted nucleotidyltransferase component of viral defense system